MAYKIMLDAGHGGFEPGAVYQGRQEKDDVLALTLAVGDILSEQGYDVDYTRTTDVYETPFEKATQANESGADLFISIHRNAFPTPNTASGVESLIYDFSGLKLEVAESINQELVNLGFRDLGVKERPNLVVLRRTQMPSVLVEAGFIDNEADNALFDQKFNEIALGIANGITNVVGMQGGGSPRYQVQVGLYKNKANADGLNQELLQAGYPSFITYDPRGYYVVYVGRYNGFSDAILMEQQLKNAGYPTLIVTV